ncbi:LacI family DNA-binding transcriptional regulator [Pasteurella multocida]|uniref:LacI family DNA-binding transcriptional regulator n=1 Tax=Pasteurella multocida TaxID=747 RepID=UPI000CE87DB8|nr:LacI family DNA-binding transcriptional regulator [Pasteurella multocida]AWB53659.1 LacI family transcriptional regulator [Pasteurella multocida]MCL7786034.1 LacI family DNA-binding transcriptional regulator [Pasteurella multocida]MCL7795843.1 LacI family DNA-binding transcriptional regulator [Pasteurella multocida]MCL7817996.1 LacI family DNA-binding transcriptional regulator [Pasteurella multocida]MEB3457320.1 LacI family DNA-binding transcriptional regulator [Pasteurella multocida]
MTKRTTIDDIAKALGVNKSTVSRAINNPSLVSNEMREKIQRMCERMNYIPNNIAKSLASSSTNSIVLLIPSFSNDVFNEVIEGVKRVCDQWNYNLLISDFSYTPLEEQRIIEKYLQQNVDGFILTETFHTQKTMDLLKIANIPTVEIMHIDSSPNFLANIGIDQYAAARYLIKFLVEEKKRKKIALCSSWLDSRACLRKTAWEDVLTECQLSTERYFRIQGKTSFTSGAESVLEILYQWPDTDAIFFINDDVAAGAIMECNRRGIKVGKELDIVGFNDLDFAKVLNPSLTTIFTPRFDMGKLGAEILIQYLAGKKPQQHIIELPFKFMRRQSA